jgi:hypothetical protein
MVRHAQVGHDKMAHMTRVPAISEVTMRALVLLPLAAALALGAAAAAHAQTPLSGPPSSASTVAPPWQNPDSPPPGAAPPPPPAVAPPRTLGTVSPIRGPARPECREFEQTVVIDGKPQNAYGTACRQADGSWKIVH